MAKQQDYQRLKEKLADRNWRLNNLYYIKDKRGQKVLFKPNWAQRTLFATMWFFNVILKARQLGFTTFIMIYMLDYCLFNSNQSAGIIAQTREDAEKLFEEKIKFAYDYLPEWLKAERKASSNNARTLEFSNGSKIYVGTSLRGGTYQILLVSEFGKIAAKYPERAKEIKSGALNTIEAGQQIFIESTAEGSDGDFYNLSQHAQKLQLEEITLTRLDPKFHFFAWWQNPKYRLTQEETENTIITPEDEEYFAEIEGKTGTMLKPDQRAWYIKKREQQGTEMKREYPSTPEEAFEAAVEGAYFSTQMASVRKNGQLRTVPYEPTQPVYTFWDLGMNDSMAIIFFQYVRGEFRFIDYYENSGESLGHYAKYLREKDYIYGGHYWPHDGNVRDLSGEESKTRQETATGLGIKPITIVPRTKSINDDIEKVRNILPKSYFDETKCALLIKHCDNFRKEWDDHNGVWKDRPRHDQASHGVSALRTLACGFKPPPDVAPVRSRRANTNYNELG